MQKTISILTIAFLLTGCAGWTFNGIKTEDIKAHPVKIAAGVAATFATHWLGHVAFLEANNIAWHQDGAVEYIDEHISHEDFQWSSRSGFIGQLAVGYILKATVPDQYFFDGYKLGTAIEVIGYPVLTPVFCGGNSDLKWMDNPGVEYGLYSMLAVGLFFETEKEK